ncbi:hypothetical protein J7K43_08260 [Candidatus Calescamantes bacterium]|nr:hypothetical protein [Candidatus Calescamantes bacterium]
MAVVTIPKVIREKLGEDGAEALTELLNEIEERAKEDNVRLVEEKFEKRLAEEIGKVRVEIAQVRADLIKWMFIFWVGQIGVLTGILFAFFK